MERVFLRLVSLSLSAGWLVLAVVLLRAVLRRAPRRILCLLWALVALRLVCPVSITSPVSLVPRAETVVQSVQERSEPSAPVAEPSGQSAVPVLSRVWFAGAAAMLFRALWDAARLRRRLRVFLPAGEGVRICDAIDTPFVLGVMHPKIYLPEGLRPADRAYVLAHERAHLSRRDHWWKPLGWLLLSVYWFQPLLWLAYVLFCRDLELACDERVAAGLDRAGLAAYSEALLHCSRARQGLALPVAFGEVGVKTRVQAILRYRKPARRAVALALFAVLAVAVLFLTERPAAAAQLQEIWQDVNEDAWTIPISERVDGAPEPTPTPAVSPSPSPSVAIQTPQPAATSANPAAPRAAEPAPQTAPPAPVVPTQTPAPQPTATILEPVSGDIVDSGGF